MWFVRRITKQIPVMIIQNDINAIFVSEDNGSPITCTGYRYININDIPRMSIFM